MVLEKHKSFDISLILLH